MRERRKAKTEDIEELERTGHRFTKFFVKLDMLVNLLDITKCHFLISLQLCIGIYTVD